jgi:DNA invertase Pin-like site-specific DNA recombinase
MIACRFHGQEENHSLLSQEVACRARAEQRGYPIASVAHEVRSGGDRNRPDLGRMIDALGRGDVLLTCALDRFSRDQTHTAVLVDCIERAGATLKLATEDFRKSASGTILRNA